MEGSQPNSVLSFAGCAGETLNKQ
ncbi:hypothetical protein LINPERHAP1_LOCUS23234 [Linum perenne]